MLLSCLDRSPSRRTCGVLTGPTLTEEDLAPGQGGPCPFVLLGCSSFPIGLGSARGVANVAPRALYGRSVSRFKVRPSGLNAVTQSILVGCGSVGWFEELDIWLSCRPLPALPKGGKRLRPGGEVRKGISK